MALTKKQEAALVSGTGFARSALFLVRPMRHARTARGLVTMPLTPNYEV